eukprot:SAG31_NODE_354_length_17223_cov_18.708771_18_plen_215_part_00
MLKVGLDESLLGGAAQQRAIVVGPDFRKKYIVDACDGTAKLEWLSALGGKQDRKMAKTLGFATKGLRKAENKLAEARNEVANRKLEIDTDAMISTIFEKFDANGDGKLSSDEYKSFLVSIDSWGKHKYTDADWASWWPEEAKNLGTADSSKGIPLSGFTLLYTNFRTSEMLVADYAAIFPQSAGNLPRRMPASSSPMAGRGKGANPFTSEAAAT